MGDYQFNSGLNIAQLLAHFRLATEVLFPLFGLPVIYEPEVLPRLEKYLDEYFPKDHPEIPIATCLLFGFFFGQVVTNHIPGAVWNEREGPEDDLSIRIPCQDDPDMVSVLFPFKTMEELWVDRSRSLLSKFELLKKLSTSPLEMQNLLTGAPVIINGEEWQVNTPEFWLKEQEEQFLRDIKKRL